jgi:peptide deformylase
MSVLPIYTYGATVLKKKALPVTEVDDLLVRLIMDMFETMRKASGIGLAATQVGVLKRVIVVDVSDIEEYKEIPPLVMINPEVLDGEGGCQMEEGCLSIPDVRDLVERVDSIRVRFRDPSFKRVEIEAGGLLARVILHEIDHLNGVLFLDHLTEEQQKTHAEALEKITRGEMDVEYPVITAQGVTA